MLPGRVEQSEKGDPAGPLLVIEEESLVGQQPAQDVLGQLRPIDAKEEAPVPLHPGDLVSRPGHGFG